MINNEKSLK